MRNFILAAVATTGLTFFTGCTKPAPTVTSASLEQSISAKFASRPGLTDVRVSADAAKNEATLSGTVITEDDRTAAVNMAKATSPGLVITDKIDVKPKEISRAEYTEDMARKARDRSKELGDKVGESLDDAWIHTKLVTKLMTDKDTPARKINVDVNDNVVVLRGKVETLNAKQEAERLAASTDGVRRVVNLLKVA